MRSKVQEDRQPPKQIQCKGKFRFIRFKHEGGFESVLMRPCIVCGRGRGERKLFAQCLEKVINTARNSLYGWGKHDPFIDWQSTPRIPGT